MDAGWLGLIIAVAIVFVFFVLVQHWQRAMRHQSRSIRRLSERLKTFESISDPLFLQRLSEAAPVPLEQVFTFSLRLDDRFWNAALHASEEEKKFVRDHGTIVGSVKLERWRSHAVATVTEVLPDRKAARWQTRSIELYSESGSENDGWTLWELPLCRPGPAAERPPSVELLLRANSLELCGHLALKSLRASGNGHIGARDFEDVSFLRVPLDPMLLADFRSHDPANLDPRGGRSHETSPRAHSWQSFYSGCDEMLGIEWQLRIHDLTRKSEWERWKILESPSIHLVSQ